MNRRVGFTLIEMVVTLALVIAMLGGTLALVSLIRTSGQRATASVRDRQEIRRLANDLRRDVADATDLEVEGSLLILTLSDPESRILYDFGSEPLFSRSVESNEPALKASDRYLINEDSQVAIRLQPDSVDDAEQEPSLVELVITLPNRPSQPIRILAAQRMPN
ncbi:PulJ/GspJ family protein [Rhodopirellula sp. P2]|uniref:PulJ/GspJ family protein n=1 Tax=Rhodopirellula sp. P2 TaxID=2127060 RepID=UPI002367B504|nr:type II secretion system protein [Rhodopirellula sp. P2]WDQ16357.1 type II secretion system protein [Rhodopirellula sp. P2]